jgi:diguanylate cyclase (GGDEF)-like protein
VVGVVSAILIKLPRATGSLVYFWLGAVLIMYMPLFGYQHGRTFHYWAYVLPASSFFLLSSRRALLAMAGFGAYAVAMEGLVSGPRDLLPFAFSYGLVALFVYSYAWLSERFGWLLRQASETDALSGCYNRRVFGEDMARVAGDAEATGALLLLDIDRFKSINDQHGHLAGDRVIAEVAARIRQALPEGARCFRYGGEEFAVLAPDLAVADAESVGARLRAAVNADLIADLRVSVSIGVAAYVGGAHAVDALTQADQALYAAKRGGRDRVVVAPLRPPET